MINNYEKRSYPLDCCGIGAITILNGSELPSPKPTTANTMGIKSAIICMLSRTLRAYFESIESYIVSALRLREITTRSQWSGTWTGT